MKTHSISENDRLVISAQKKYIESVRNRFDYADLAQHLAEDKNQVDLIFITEKFSEWYSKATGKPELLKTMNEVLVALFRVQSYINHIETVAKHSVAITSSVQKENDRLKSEITLLKLSNSEVENRYKKELENVKKEIDFINSGNGK